MFAGKSTALPPQRNALIDVTRSNNGFAAHVTFIPAMKLGVVVRANKRYDADAMVTRAYGVLSRLGRPPTSTNH